MLATELYKSLRVRNKAADDNGLFTVPPHSSRNLLPLCQIHRNNKPDIITNNWNSSTEVVNQPLKGKRTYIGIVNCQL